jgi:predicted ATPase/DNA-binding CsgD family transcriptional regulator
MVERAHNLPAQPTPLIGREREVRAACDLLADDAVRLVTLTGPGGTGKTRVGIQVASALRAAFPDGVVFVGLAPIVDPSLVIPTIARAVGVSETGNRPEMDALQAHVREKRLLLLLDNFEQILAAAPNVSALLAACPGVKALVTSRARLRLRGEHEYPVPPLSLPEQQGPDQPSAADTLARNPAVALFVQRAREVQPDFRLTDENAEAVAEICRRLDGLPLAIELAAARTKVLAPQALLARLERRLPFLTGGPRDAPERQRTLRDTLAWSYDLLTPDEQRLFRRLGVFVGGCTLPAAEAVCIAPGDAVLDMLDALASLVDKSLLRQAPGPDGEPRFTMLETIREYALEQLAASGEEEAARRRHLSWLCDLASAYQGRRVGRDAVLHRDLTALEQDNFWAALAWSQADPTPESARAGLRLITDSFMFLHDREHPHRIRHWLELSLHTDHHVNRPAEHHATAWQSAVPAAFAAHPRVAACCQLGILGHHGGDLQKAVEVVEQGLELARRRHDLRGEAHCLITIGGLGRSAGRYEQAIPHLEAGLEAARRDRDPMTLWRALQNLAESVMAVGQIERARRLLEEALAVARSMEYAFGIAMVLRLLGGVVARQGDAKGGAALVEESLALWRQVQSKRGLYWSLLDLGRIALDLHDPRRVALCFAESLTICQEFGDRRGIAKSLEGLAALGAETASRPYRAWSKDAAQLLGATMASREADGTPLVAVDLPAFERAVAAAGQTLGQDAYAEAVAEGRVLSLAQAVEVGLQLASEIEAVAATVPASRSRQAGRPAESAAASSVGQSLLTAREREVAALVGQGYSNRRIAERLVIAEKTAEVHARNIREKLGLESRAQIAAWAAQHGLLDSDA